MTIYAVRSTSPTRRDGHARTTDDGKIPRMCELSFTERLALLVDHQWICRQNQALTRRLRNANLRTNACLEDMDYRTPTGPGPKCAARPHPRSAWVKQHDNILRLGPTGVGESFVACALAQKACREGYSEFIYPARLMLMKGILRSRWPARTQYRHRRVHRLPY